ncbi:hypothetical protein EB796_002584 [Bugula neritina]|uniref:Uncharacterized protein n=1 Tax=Bugula neritina TaxID=10212 RepID=A0A7J7KKA8_BUGNE|nr:hypothetical protein EB796_002584 [Bugula neritina]
MSTITGACAKCLQNISVHHQGAAINLPSEFQAVENIAFDAYAVCSSDGERLRLNHEVSLEDGVEVWLSRLKVEVEETLRTMLTQIIEDVNNSQAMEDMVFKVSEFIYTIVGVYLKNS